jgi:hypothetical protein
MIVSWLRGRNKNWRTQTEYYSYAGNETKFLENGGYDTVKFLSESEQH